MIVLKINPVMISSKAYGVKEGQYTFYMRDCKEVKSNPIEVTQSNQMIMQPLLFKKERSQSIEH